MSYNNKIHPVTDAVLLAQRAKLAELLPSDVTLADQMRICMEIYWHALFTLCATGPVDPYAVAQVGRDAMQKGIEFRQAREVTPKGNSGPSAG